MLTILHYDNHGCGAIMTLKWTQVKWKRNKIKTRTLCVYLVCIGHRVEYIIALFIPLLSEHSCNIITQYSELIHWSLFYQHLKSLTHTLNSTTLEFRA